MFPFSLLPPSLLSAGKKAQFRKEGIRAAVLADMGLAVTSDWMFWPELQRGDVRRVVEDWALPEIALWAVFPAGRLASAKAQSFADFVQSALL